MIVLDHGFQVLECEIFVLEKNEQWHFSFDIDTSLCAQVIV